MKGEKMWEERDGDGGREGCDGVTGRKKGKRGESTGKKQGREGRKRVSHLHSVQLPDLSRHSTVNVTVTESHNVSRGIEQDLWLCTWFGANRERCRASAPCALSRVALTRLTELDHLMTRRLMSLAHPSCSLPHYLSPLLYQPSFPNSMSPQEGEADGGSGGRLGTTGPALVRQYTPPIDYTAFDLYIIGNRGRPGCSVMCLTIQQDVHICLPLICYTARPT
ncbi:unnamed protein product [Pleuronectes platessa]|uniref:Uncharacterized protein n=1 Tax=Pleuronectes platessa TaxID=8262 RepID=A0A9N7Z4J9_PLEPL|nr:unnamed protein product [Pleuronectes platessa]